MAFQQCLPSAGGATTSQRCRPFGSSLVAPLQRAAACHSTARRSRSATAMAAVAPHQSMVDLANQLADAAAVITSRYFRSAFDVESKADASPVTIADRQAEDAMRRLIGAAFPEHGIFGEEAGLTPGVGGDGKWVWVLDPIDGTKSFITGKPLFGTLISLLHDGVPVLGIIDQPILKERWLGVHGRPTTLNGKEIKTRACADVAKAYLYATTPHMFGGANETAFNRLRDRVRIPMYGCDCYAYGLLATGLCDIVCEADLKPYDYMALVPVIQGAGGIVTDWSGQPLHWKAATNADGSVIAAPGEVLAAGDTRSHQQALQLLDWKKH